MSAANGSAEAGAGIFPDWRTPLSDAVNAALDALIVRFGDQFEAFADALLRVLVLFEQGLQALPPLAVLLAVLLCAGLLSRRPLFALGVTGGMWLVGALGHWALAMQSMALVLVSVALCLLLGLPLGIVCARSARVRSVVSPLLDLMQTIPSFVYLIPAVMLFGLGKVPAILATVVYAMPPLIRLTDLGIRQVGRESVEAGLAFGLSRWQLLRKVQVPEALPAIMQGVNQTTMMALAMVVIASMIGARGVGETVLLGLQRNDAGEGVVGGLVIVILAISLDRLLQAAGRRLQPQGGR